MRTLLYVVLMSQKMSISTAPVLMGSPQYYGAAHAALVSFFSLMVAFLTKGFAQNPMLKR